MAVPHHHQTPQLRSSCSHLNNAVSGCNVVLPTKAQEGSKVCVEAGSNCSQQSHTNTCHTPALESQSHQQNYQRLFQVISSSYARWSKDHSPGQQQPPTQKKQAVTDGHTKQRSEPSSCKSLLPLRVQCNAMVAVTLHPCIKRLPGHAPHRPTSKPGYGSSTTWTTCCSQCTGARQGQQLSADPLWA